MLNSVHSSTTKLFKVKKPRYVRVNTLQITPDEIIKIFRSKGWFFIPPCIDYSEFLEKISNLDDYSFTRDFHIKELLVFPGNIQLYNDELYKNGSILLQDKASCLPAFLLNPTPNSITLDMCAAPGMKTTHLSAIMRNKGKIFSVELDPDRYNTLCNMIQSTGCANVIPINKDSLKLDINDKTHAALKDVEYILVDPSCSGSGIVERNNIFSKDKYSPKRLKKLCRFQFKLLKHALTNFPKVKRVVYSTCSVLSIENEQVVEDVLIKLNSEVINENEGVAVQEKIPKFKIVEPLMESWPRRGSNEFQHGKFCLYSDPKKDLTNGFFVAVFERIDDEITDVKFEKTNKLKKKGKKTNEKKTEENENIFHE